MIKKNLIASFVLAALFFCGYFNQLHAAKGRRTTQEIKEAAKIEWTRSEILDGKDVAFEKAVNALSKKSPEALRDYLAKNKLKRYSANVDAAKQQNYYQTILAALQTAVKKSPGSVAANDLAQEFTRFVSTVDLGSARALNLDAKATELTTLAQAAGGGPAAPPAPAPAPAVQEKEDAGLKRLQTIAEIESVLAAPIGFTDAFSNTDTLSLQDFMKALGDFLINKFDNKAQERLHTLAKTVEMYNNVFTFEMEANFLLLRHLRDDWKDFYNDFSKKQLITTLNKAIFAKKRLARILSDIKKEPLSELLQADPSASKKSSGVYNSKLHDIWYQAQPSLIESFRKPKPTTAQQVQDVLKNFDFADLEKSFNDTQSARNIIDKLSKQTFWKDNPLLVEEIKNKNKYKELASLEEKFNNIQQEFITNFNSGKIPADYSKKTPDEAADFVKRAKSFLKTLEPWTDITKDKAGILVGEMRSIKSQTREDAIATAAEELKNTFMSEKIGFDSAFGDKDSSIEAFIKSLNDFLQACDANTQAKFSDDQKQYFGSLKKFHDIDYELNINQKVAATKSELELGELRLNAESFKEKLQKDQLPLRNLLKADDPNKNKPQHRNALLGSLWIAKIIADIEEILAWKIDFNNAFSSAGKLTIPEFMGKLKEYLNKFDKDARTRMEKGWYKSWMPKIYDGLKTFYEVDWLKDFKKKFDKPADIKTLADAEDLLKQLTAIKQAITDKVFDGVNIFANNMEGISVGWTSNGNLNNMSNYATPMKRWLIDWIVGPTNMPTEAEDATQANEILKQIDLDKIKKNLDTTAPIKTEIDTLAKPAVTADENRTNKVKADNNYAELEGLEKRFNDLKTEYDGETINTPALANDFKTRVENLSTDIADWSILTNEKPAKLKAALEAIPVIVQKIAEITLSLKKPVGYDNAFGKVEMTITEFINSLKTFVNQFTEEDKNYLSNSPKTNLTALQERCTKYDNFFNKLSRIDETDTVKKVTDLAATIEILVTEIKKGVVSKFYANIDDDKEVDPHTRNNLLKTIWTEVMIGRKVSALQKKVFTDPCTFNNAFGKETDSLETIMQNVKTFLDDFDDNDRQALKDDRKTNFEQLQIFYDSTWQQEIKTLLDKHLKDSNQIKTIETAEKLEIKLQKMQKQMREKNDGVGKLFYPDAPSMEKTKDRNKLLSAIWTEGAIATQIRKINETLSTSITFDTHFGQANAFTVNTFMEELKKFLDQFDETAKQRLASAQLSFAQVRKHKKKNKLKEELRVTGNLDSLIDFYKKWVTVVKTQGESEYNPSNIKDLKTATALLKGFEEIKNGIITDSKKSIKKLIEGPVGENQYLKNINKQSKPSVAETLITEVADKGILGGLVSGLDVLNKEAEEKRKQELAKKITEIDKLLNTKISYDSAFGAAQTVSLQDLMKKLSDFLIKFKEPERTKFSTKDSEFAEMYKNKNNERPQATKLKENFNTLVRANNAWEEIFKDLPDKKYNPDNIKNLEEATQFFTAIETFYYSKITPEKDSIRPLLENNVWNKVKNKNISCLDWLAHWGGVSVEEAQPLTEAVQPSSQQVPSVFNALHQQVMAQPSPRFIQTPVENDSWSFETKIEHKE